MVSLGDFFLRICAEKVLVVEGAVLLGICAFLVCFVMVNRGEFVVECVVNVVFYRTLFRGPKMGQVFEVYFLVAAVLGRGYGEGKDKGKCRCRDLSTALLTIRP